MGLPLMILRFVATPLLGIAIFFGLLLTLVESNISNKLLDADFYTATISEYNTYARIYDEVLLDQKAKDKMQELLEGVKVVNPEDIVGLVRGLLPPEYLQAQVEASIQRSLAYFNDDSDTLELYLELGPPLQQIKPTLFEYIDRRIDGIPEGDPGAPECTPATVKRVGDRYQEVFRSLGSGQVPAELPSIKAIPEPCRTLIFDEAFPALFADDSLDERSKLAMAKASNDIRTPFIAGDTHGVLKAAARPLAEPVLDDAIGKLRDRLDEGDRLNLIRVIAETSGDYSEPELRSEMAEVKEAVVQYRTLGGTIAFLMLYGGAILLAVLHLPKLSAAMRWPGIFLFVSGGLIFIVGKIF